MEFDALLLLSFGGPEAPEHVMPFLENVTRGRGIPPDRLASVAEHYLHFGGVSPINGINRELISAIEAVIDLPVYFGNRNWAPYVENTVATMRDNGIRRAAVFATSAWGGYSSCTQYVEDIARARAAAGDGAPELVKLRQYYDHPLFVEMFTEAIGAAAQTVPDGARLDVRRVACQGWVVSTLPPSFTAIADLRTGANEYVGRIDFLEVKSTPTNGGSAWAISDDTVAGYMPKDLPRSPCTRPWTYSRNCIHIGWSRPNWAE